MGPGEVLNHVHLTRKLNNEGCSTVDIKFHFILKSCD